MADEKKPDARTPLQVVQERRAARQADLKAQEDAQRAKDLEAVDALEVEHGDSCVAFVTVQYQPGLPTGAAVRAPHPAEVKRYRDLVRPKPGRGGQMVHPDPCGPAEQIADACRLYPDAETYVQLTELRSGLRVSLGLAALDLVAGREEAEGKG